MSLLINLPMDLSVEILMSWIEFPALVKCSSAFTSNNKTSHRGQLLNIVASYPFKLNLKANNRRLCWIANLEIQIGNVEFSFHNNEKIDQLQSCLDNLKTGQITHITFSNGSEHALGLIVNWLNSCDNLKHLEIKWGSCQTEIKEELLLSIDGKVLRQLKTLEIHKHYFPLTLRPLELFLWMFTETLTLPYSSICGN